MGLTSALVTSSVHYKPALTVQGLKTIIMNAALITVVFDIFGEDQQEAPHIVHEDSGKQPFQFHLEMIILFALQIPNHFEFENK